MKFIAILLVAVVIGMMIEHGLSADARATVAVHQADLNARNEAESRGILARLEAMHDDKVSEFVRDWQQERGSSPNDLQELRVIEQKIKNDPRSAVGFTHAAKMADADHLSNTLQPLFGNPEAAPAPAGL